MTSLLRPRLAAIAAAPRCIRLFSVSRARRSGQFTISVPAASSKKSVLDELQSRRDVLAAQNIAPAPSSPDNAAVVLASPEFATWLEDESFMSGLLQGIPLAKSPEGVSVLVAVVAALAPPADQIQRQFTLSGLSVAYGNTDCMLPTIWHNDASETSLRGSRGSIGSDIDKDAAITIEVPPLDASSSSPLRVTLPLANTIFQNGRRSTLLAGRWASSPGSSSLSLSSIAPHEHDVIIPPFSLSSSSASTSTATSPSLSSVSAVLFPIAEPLTIAAGLGNIVRQVYDPADPTHKKPIPAARELESAIPALLAARKRSDPTLQDGAMSVWSLVVPAPLVSFYEQLKQQTSPALDALSNDAGAAEHTAEAEQKAAALSSQQFTTLLAAGCRLHKILSGGGGWGLKQGLLSLDPQMSHPAAVFSSKGSDDAKILGEERRDDEMDDEAMLSFIRSFKSEVMEDEESTSDETETVDGVAMPGAVVQFFVAPLESNASRDSKENADAGTDSGPKTSYAHSITLGAQIGYDGSSPAAEASSNGSHALAFFHNHFGAVSNHGIFLASSDAPSASPSIRTKLDAPNSHVSYVG
ncbi:6-phosphogluconate dehydrogenase [Ophiostoma piceae UAMH 11346]|uniref:6-phosphogluconate dehydrogenase n=1 Tax=Ophiostoma piceae (strain UAMH 11346) TaxID=1262450 RepID=S3C3I3_OPHP1|nr:6-phosphogluconate dehydrogenase [Ophiostoma piceae UAMH 11346]